MSSLLLDRRWWETLPNRLRYCWLVIYWWRGNLWTMEEADALCRRDHVTHAGDCIKPGDRVWVRGELVVITRICEHLSAGGKMFHMVSETMPNLDRRP